MEVYFLILFGLILGSFFNAWALRTVKNESIIKGRSKCSACNHQLSWCDLVPVISFVFLKGRCQYCHQSISWQYPAVELVTAILFLGLYVKFGLSFNFFFTALTTSFLLLIFLTDARAYVIPDKFSWSGIIIILMMQIWRHADLGNLSLAALIGGGFFLLQYVISRGRWIGAGDIGLGVLMGIILGFPLILIALALAYIGGTILVLLLIVLGKKPVNSQIPFGAYLAVATFITLIWGFDWLGRLF